MSETKQEWRLPKNIRQIGDGSGAKKIYVEDYVITYLGGLAEKGGGKKALLFGNVKEKDASLFLFIDGALEVETFYMDDSAKEELQEKMGRYFGGKRVMGWFLASEESPFVMKRDIVETFQKEFPGENQILLVKDPQENETAVFMKEEEVPAEQPGYYIYYDKNPSMQEYMISISQGKSVDSSEETPDKAIKSFRKIIKSKKQLPGIPRKYGKLVYLAGGFLMMTVLALGVTMVYNYDRMKEVERSLARLTNNVDSQREYVTDNQGDAAPVMLHMEEEETEYTEASASDVLENTGVEEGETGIQSQEELQEDQETTGEDGAMKTEGETEPQSQTASALPRTSYIIKVGDTLAGISEMYYGSLEKVSEICTLNGITDENTILPGQKILLP